MVTAILFLGAVLLGGLAGGWTGFFWANARSSGQVRENRKTASEVLEETARLKDSMIKEAELEAREAAFRIRVSAEEEVALKKQEHARRDQ